MQVSSVAKVLSSVLGQEYQQNEAQSGRTGKKSAPKRTIAEEGAALFSRSVKSIPGRAMCPTRQLLENTLQGRKFRGNKESVKGKVVPSKSDQEERVLL